MSVLIYDILNAEKLGEHACNGYVTIKPHNEFPELRIANYTDKCTFDRQWDDVTRKTRGLIWNAVSGEVLARPFEKFFNYNEPSAPDFDWDTPVYAVANKEDGSLAIPYIAPDNSVRIATRGSFHSEQAELAMRVLTTGEAEEIRLDLNQSLTPVFEIVGPDNRIVLSYPKNELEFLALVRMRDGWVYPANTIPKPRPSSLRELLEEPPRKNAEGYVVWIDMHTAVKIKQQDYIELHRIVTGLTKKEVWRWLRDGVFSDRLEHVPEEFQEDIAAWDAQLALEFEEVFSAADGYKTRLDETGLEDRKSQALWIREHVPPDLTGFVFGLLDGRDITDGIYRYIEPKGA